MKSSLTPSLAPPALLGVASLFFALHLSAHDTADEVLPALPATPVQHDFALWCRAEGHLFYFENNTLADVVQTLKKGTILNTDADHPGKTDPLWAVEYQDSTHLIRFLSDGDMGGSDHDITGIEINPLDSRSTSQPRPRLNGPLTFEFGSLGLSFSQLQHRLGPAALHDRKVRYVYNGTLVLKKTINMKKPAIHTAGDGVTTLYISADLVGEIRHNNLISLQIFHLTETSGNSYP